MKRRSPIVASGFVEGGRIQWDNARLATAPLKAWEGERVTVTIAQEELNRSTRANAYLWGVVYKLMSEESGYTPEELHEVMRERHNGRTIIDPFTGEEKRIGLPTRDLKVEPFGHFIEAVMVDGAEWLGISFPEPRKHEEWREGKAAA